MLSPTRFTALVLLIMTTSLPGATPPAMDIPDDFPRFTVPGHDNEMNSIRRLFWLHYEHAGPLIPLWDEWMAMSTLWPARGAGSDLQSMPSRWAQALASRPMTSDGYIYTQQHDGPAHAQGWPFPRWMEAGGIGWHFVGTGIPGYDAPLVKPDDWKLTAANAGEVSKDGWILNLTDAQATAQPPAFAKEAKNLPWLRLNWWATGLEGAKPFVEWTTKDSPEFTPGHRTYLSPPDASDPKHTESRTMIPMYRLPGWQGTITGLRIHFDNSGPASIIIKSFHSACDTRHNINNSNFIRGCHDYFMWTRDLDFLRSQISRMRIAMRFMMSEFDTRNRKCVYITWPGHEGRSGIHYVDGKKVIVKGQGIGSNYWDLLPFGGEDALATVYYYDAVRDLADLEEQIAINPKWSVASSADAFDPADLRQHAQEVKDHGTQRFWNEKTGRFGTRDLDGTLHDYGFTFLNNEAVYYNFATPAQAKSIHAWIAGQRTVEGDTAIGPDIYHWRFGPRSTTKRNIDYYFWGWSSPEKIPFGYQVQDGGAVLGFSYHDLMARLMTAGPDDAAHRLSDIATWFEETQSAGGYRKYYEADKSRGTMQGANVAGGLGLDKEFFESILVPQVMLYGFLGLKPTADGCTISPKLPSDWPSLQVTRIHLHDHVIDVKVEGKIVTVHDSTAAGEQMRIQVPDEFQVKRD
jgi:hypothetical protein